MSDQERTLADIQTEFETIRDGEWDKKYRRVLLLLSEEAIEYKDSALANTISAFLQLKLHPSRSWRTRY